MAKGLLPASRLGGAFNTIRNHWKAFDVFVNDRALPIDNNQVERLMTRIAVGTKNWFFIGSPRAGVRNASLMSLVASALRQDLDVAMYLESVITHMLRGPAKTEELLPNRWKARIPRRCVSNESKSAGTRSTWRSYKQHGDECGLNYAKISSDRRSILQVSTVINLLEGAVRLRLRAITVRRCPPILRYRKL